MDKRYRVGDPGSTRVRRKFWRNWGTALVWRGRVWDMATQTTTGRTTRLGTL